MNRLRELPGEFLLRGCRHQIDLDRQDPFADQVTESRSDERGLAVAARRDDSNVLAVADIRLELSEFVGAVGEGFVRDEIPVGEGISSLLRHRDELYQLVCRSMNTAVLYITV